MRSRLAAFALPTALVAGLLVLAGAGAAATLSIQGTMPNGGCGPIQPVVVSGPSRIDVHASSAAAETSDTYVQILDASGNALTESSYESGGGGTFGVRICNTQDGENAPPLSYSALIGTGPPGQSALPTPLATPAAPGVTPGVAGVAVSSATSAVGRGAIHTHASLAWFTIHVTTQQVSVSVVDAARSVDLSATAGLKARFGIHSVTIMGDGMTLLLAQTGAHQHLMFHARTFSASGNVVRGGFSIA